jgi:hypothetical protein
MVYIVPMGCLYGQVGQQLSLFVGHPDVRRVQEHRNKQNTRLRMQGWNVCGLPANVPALQQRLQSLRNVIHSSGGPESLQHFTAISKAERKALIDEARENHSACGCILCCSEIIHHVHGCTLRDLMCHSCCGCWYAAQLQCGIGFAVVMFARGPASFRRDKFLGSRLTEGADGGVEPDHVQ